MFICHQSDQVKERKGGDATNIPAVDDLLITPGNSSSVGKLSFRAYLPSNLTNYSERHIVPNEHFVEKLKF
jgi:hypothetical protein